MKAHKWNFKSHSYEDYELPEGVEIIACLKDVISCANCGTKHEFGTMYTSRKIHNAFGIGYPVCEKCYNQEYKEYLDSKKGM